jgi:hypothetical protein
MKPFCEVCKENSPISELWFGNTKEQQTLDMCQKCFVAFYANENLDKIYKIFKEKYKVLK